MTDSTPVRPGKRNETTPVEPHQIERDFVSCSHDSTLGPIPGEVLKSFTQSLLQLKDAFDSMKKEMSAFTTSLNSTSEDIETFRKEILDIKKELRDLDRYKVEVIELRAEVLQLRQEAESKQQRQFLKDVELSGVTEHHGENLSFIISNLTAKLGVELDPRDIEDVRRVGRRNGGGSGTERPRPIILTLTRRAPRDQLLRAARVRRGLTTEMLQVAGGQRRVYLNEHLTKSNRVLFSKARSVGSQLKFKYVWSSNGNIFMRRTETSSVLSVSTETILEKLLAQNSSQQLNNQQHSETEGLNKSS